MMTCAASADCPACHKQLAPDMKLAHMGTSVNMGNRYSSRAGSAESTAANSPTPELHPEHIPDGLTPAPKIVGPNRAEVHRCRRIRRLNVLTATARRFGPLTSGSSFLPRRDSPTVTPSKSWPNEVVTVSSG